jgi:hypothetical protein
MYLGYTDILIYRVYVAAKLLYVALSSHRARSDIGQEFSRGETRLQVCNDVILTLYGSLVYGLSSPRLGYAYGSSSVLDVSHIQLLRFDLLARPALVV